MTAIERNLEKHIPSLINVWRESCGRGSLSTATGKKVSTQQLSSVELQTVSKALLDLQRGLTGTRELAGSGYMENTSYVGAYLLYYWPVSYLQISYATSDALKRIQPKMNENQKNKTLRILDLGSGPAPASAALIDALRYDESCSFEVTLVDSSEKALSLAQKVFAQEYPAVATKKIICNFEKPVSLTDEYDVIVMCHALNELWKNETDCIERRTSFLEQIAAHLTDDGIMLLCEPALLATSRNLLKVRDMLLQKKFYVIAPCVKNEKQTCRILVCPALAAGENHTCHAEIEWQPCEPVSSLAQKAGLDRESVKMTYVVLQKQKTSILQKEKHAVEEQSGNPAERKTICGRVVSEGMLNKAGRIRFLICDGRNRIAVSAKKEDAHAKQIGFFSLKRLDSISLSAVEIRGDKQTIAYGIGPDTKLQKLN